MAKNKKEAKKKEEQGKPKTEVEVADEDDNDESLDEDPAATNFEALPPEEQSKFFTDLLATIRKVKRENADISEDALACFIKGYVTLWRQRREERKRLKVQLRGPGIGGSKDDQKRSGSSGGGGGGVGGKPGAAGGKGGAKRGSSSSLPPLPTVPVEAAEGGTAFGSDNIKPPVPKRARTSSPVTPKSDSAKKGGPC